MPAPHQPFAPAEAFISYRAIGVVRSPWQEAAGTPLQPSAAHPSAGQVILAPELAPALVDLAGFSHIILLYHFHRAAPPSLLVTPYLDSSPRGVFATRAPSRPNPIGLSVLRLVAVVGTTLEVEGVDILDGTPVLDLKPFVPAFDVPAGEVRIGWLTGRIEAAAHTTADRRFASEAS